MTFEAVITDDLVAQPLQVSRHRGANVTAMSRHQNPHDPMIGGRPVPAPTNFGQTRPPGDGDVRPPYSVITILP
jgi:hypothetical protein